MPDGGSPMRHLNPYADVWMQYRKSGWHGVLPIPYKQKHPPPTGFTGHAAKYPTVEECKEWASDGKRHNICIRLAGVDKEHEIVGIDVDNYASGEKQKSGGEQLAALQARLGALPDTWISSARTDGVSGIRFFRVPRGLAFRGQVDKDIECIQKGHRFAVVYPSVHPDAGTYVWYEPGTPPALDASGRRNAGNVSLPDARQLPILPDAWINELTQNRMLAGEHEALDMESSVDDMYAWADDTFHGNEASDLCPKMRSSVEKLKIEIESEATSHDKITKAHWHITRLAAEGHLGYAEAVNEIEAFYLGDVIKRDKRGKSEVGREIFRSRVNALRKVKAQCDQRVSIGAAPVDPACDETGMCGTDEGHAAFGVAAGQPDGGEDGPPDPLNDIPGGALLPTGDYEMNDDGNGEHFVDMFSTNSLGPSMRWVEGHGWIVWHEGEPGDEDKQPHWELDQLGDQEIRRMWQRVKRRQLNYVDALEAAYDTELTSATNQGLPLSGAGAPIELVAARAEFRKWQKFAELSGNNRNAENAVNAAKSHVGVAIDVNSLDQNGQILGVANGIVELDGENVRLRRAVPNDYVTLNTGVAWTEHPSQFAMQKWAEYLDTFLPDADLRETAQIALGHTLIGGNPEKIMIVLKGDPNTGKSTMVNAIESAMGDYAQTVSSGIFQAKQFNSTLANAIRKRVVVASEFDERDQLSASMVKRLTGGTDKISSEIKYSMATIEGVPQFVPILATNGVPEISGADKALQNRLYVIPFNVTPKYIDKRGANIVKTVCAPAVLNWLIQGYLKYMRVGGLPMNTDVQAETEEFVSELDEIATFLAQTITKSSHIGENIKWQDQPEWCVRNDHMYEHFQRWWMENSYQQRDKPNQNRFTRRMKSLGMELKAIRLAGQETQKMWVGIKMKTVKSNVLQIAMIKPASVTD